MKKEFYLIDAVTLVDYYKNLSNEKKNAIPLKVYYSAKKAIEKLTPDAKRFTEFRDEEVQKIQEKYTTDEKSEYCDIPKVDENGEPVLDNDGNPVVDAGRKIKEDFMDDYKNELIALDATLSEILKEKNTYEYNGADIGSMIEDLPEDSVLENSDIDFLDILLSKDDNENKEDDK